MRNATLLQQVAVLVAMVGLCVPQVALGANLPAKQAPVVSDVGLQEGGVLLGQVIDPQGTPLAGVPVSLLSGGRELVSGKTNAKGLFAFRGLGSGLYQVVAAKGHGAFRVWPQEVAPPAAQPGALIVAGGQTVRGQYGLPTFRNLLSNPWVIAGLVATAIAVPVAIHNQDDGPAS